MVSQLGANCHIYQEDMASSLKWCRPGYVPVKGRLCSLDIDLFAVGMLSFYLSQEFTSVIVIPIYILHLADARTDFEVISSTVTWVQTGDFMLGR